MMSEPALLPCPFCGAPGKLFDHQMDQKTTLWWVQCNNSHCIARRLERKDESEWQYILATNLAQLETGPVGCAKRTKTYNDAF